MNTSGNALRFATPRQPFGIEPNLNRPFDVTADGQKLLVNSWDEKEGAEPGTLVLSWPAGLKK